MTVYEAFYNFISYFFPSSVLTTSVYIPFTQGNSMTLGTILVIFTFALTLGFLYLVVIRQLSRLFKSILKDRRK